MRLGITTGVVSMAAVGLLVAGCSGASEQTQPGSDNARQDAAETPTNSWTRSFRNDTGKKITLDIFAGSGTFSTQPTVDIANGSSVSVVYSNIGPTDQTSFYIRADDSNPYRPIVDGVSLGGLECGKDTAVHYKPGADYTTLIEDKHDIGYNYKTTGDEGLFECLGNLENAFWEFNDAYTGDWLDSVYLGSNTIAHKAVAGSCPTCTTNGAMQIQIGSDTWTTSNNGTDWSKE